VTPPSCPACGRPQGSNGACLSCRDAAARELAREAKDVTDATLAARAEAAGRFLDRPPWYARVAAGRVLTKVRLLRMVLGDYAAGRYRKLPWAAAVAWNVVKKELRAYCAWKGLSPAHFGL